MKMLDLSDRNWSRKCCAYEFCAKDFTPVNGNQKYCCKKHCTYGGRLQNIAKHRKLDREQHKRAYTGDRVTRRRAYCKTWYQANREYVLQKKRLERELHAELEGRLRRNDRCRIQGQAQP